MNTVGTTEIDGTLEGEIDGFNETDGLDVLEGANEPIDGLLDCDGFTDGDLDGLEEGFIDTDGALEAFEVGFDEGPAEVRVGFDDAAVVGEAVVGDAVGDAVGLAVGEAVGEAVGDAVGLSVGALVGGAVGASVGAGVTATVGALVATGALVGADVYFEHFFKVFFGGLAFFSLFLHFSSFFAGSFFLRSLDSTYRSNSCDTINN